MLSVVVGSEELFVSVCQWLWLRSLMSVNNLIYMQSFYIADFISFHIAAITIIISLIPNDSTSSYSSLALFFSWLLFACLFPL